MIQVKTFEPVAIEERIHVMDALRGFERLTEGEYLNDEHTDLLLEIMKSVTTGDRCIKSGLPKGTLFAHKTGTQIGRACNMGIIYLSNSKDKIIIVACAEKYNELSEAESAFNKIGRLISANCLK